MSQFPSLPLFTDAYFGDTKHLTCEEHGAYLQLLMIAWRSPGCGIPNDDAKIARMIGLSAKRWQAIKPTIMAFWSLDEDGFWRQSRLTKERRWVAERSEKRAAAGRMGGRPKSLENHDANKANGFSEESKTKAPNPNPINNSPSLRSGEGAPKKARKPETEIDPNLQPDEVDIAYAVSKGISRSLVMEEWERFVNRNVAKGQKYRDWKAAWRTWCSSPYRKTSEGPPTGRPATRQSAQATFFNIAREAHLEELNARSEPHDRPFDNLDGEILGPDAPQPTTRRAHLAVYERPGSEAWDRDEEGYPGRVRAFG